MAKLIIILSAFVVVCNGFAVVPQSATQVLSYYLYTRDTPIGVQLSSDAADLANAPFIDAARTIVLVHGHGGNYLNSLNPLVRQAILTVENANVVVVDWSPYAGLSYNLAVTTVPAIGTAVAQYLTILVANTSVALDNLHLVGFNLGAHVAGIAGRNIEGTVARITGLDPSGSQWGMNSQRLHIDDASYVEVIHTDGSGLLSNGIGTPLGNIDFFANGGSSQPGCITHTCCHERAFELFAASMINPTLAGQPCASGLQMTLNRCRGFPLNLGGLELSKQGSGMYRVNTRRNFPF